MVFICLVNEPVEYVSVGEQESLSLQTSGLLAPLSRICNSILAMKIFAKATAVSMPIGFPCVCK